MSKVLTRSWLKRHHVLATWIGCFVGGRLGVAIGWVALESPPKGRPLRQLTLNSYVS